VLALGEEHLRLAALTNSTERVARAQLEHADIIEAFEVVLSADAVRRLKPAPEPYRMAADRLGVEVGDVLLVAAHAWDVAGAKSFGYRVAWCNRLGAPEEELGVRADYVVRTLADLPRP